MTNGLEDRIQFHFQGERFFLPQRKKLKAFIIRQLKKEGKQIEAINYVFCTDAYLLQMNQEFLSHDTLTDIITFELSPKGQPLLSDIYISIERVRENSKTFATTFKKEIHRVIFHGSLHLSGYKDKTKEQARQIRAKEEEWMSLYFVPRETNRKKD